MSLHALKRVAPLKKQQQPTLILKVWSGSDAACTLSSTNGVYLQSRQTSSFFSLEDDEHERAAFDFTGSRTKFIPECNQTQRGDGDD